MIDVRRAAMAVAVAAGLWVLVGVVMGVGTALVMPGASMNELQSVASTTQTLGIAAAGFGGAWYYTR